MSVPTSAEFEVEFEESINVSGGVTNVKVDGVSVVDEDGIAQINGMASEDWVEENYRTADDQDEIDDELEQRIEALSVIGKYLAMWNCATGLPSTNPTVLPYSFRTGDYYIVGVVGSTNYKPNGTTYNGTASTTVDSSTIEIGDMYRFDGTSWELLKYSAVLANLVRDVTVNGASVVSNKVAVITDMASALELASHEANTTSHTTASEKATWNGKADAPVIKTTMDAVAVAGCEYMLGTQTTVAFALPSTPSAGDEIAVVFYSGSTAATLTVTGTYLGTLPTPTTNQRIEMSFLYDGTNWCLLSNTVATA